MTDPRRIIGVSRCLTPQVRAYAAGIPAGQVRFRDSPKKCRFPQVTAFQSSVGWVSSCTNGLPISSNNSAFGYSFA
jgi:hypothetical protein